MTLASSVRLLRKEASKTHAKPSWTTSKKSRASWHRTSSRTRNSRNAMRRQLFLRASWWRCAKRRGLKIAWRESLSRCSRLEISTRLQVKTRFRFDAQLWALVSRAKSLLILLDRLSKRQKLNQTGWSLWRLGLMLVSKFENLGSTYRAARLRSNSIILHS